ncbi:MAG: serine/threonine protein kinase, partial [Deltaproteobacteria bacterium]|nr:serine/threonine protein kinase [Deltaproteobacteria bacterium]
MGLVLNYMSDHRKTNFIDITVPITSDIVALYEILRSSIDPGVRIKASAHLLKLIENGVDVDREVILDLFGSEKDIKVATELKRALNKLKVIETYPKDPTSKYDKKLSPEEEASIVTEIEKLKRLYDKSSKEDGAFEKKYRIIERIADGGMGRIYKAFKLEDRQVVAIKFLLLEELAKQNDRERIIARFRREGEILKRLSHPNIIRGFEYGEAGGEYFLVMEHVEGETLEDRLKRSPLDFQTFKTMALQLCDAVEYLHKHQIIHRDIKPGNILIFEAEKDMRIKLF